jgi:osmotically-inducible protein OsmY
MMAVLPSTRPATEGWQVVRASFHDDERRRVELAAQEKLLHTLYPEIRHLICEFHEGILSLRGRVSSFYMKQQAQATLKGLEGVERVMNHVEVRRRG